MEPETEHGAVWKDMLLKSYFPNGSPWFLVNSVFWQYWCFLGFDGTERFEKRHWKFVSKIWNLFWSTKMVKKLQYLYGGKVLD